MHPYIYLALFLGAFLSGLIVLVFKIEKKLLKLLLSFSGAFLFSICILHLLPELYAGGNNSIGFFILAGFFFQILLEFFSNGIEHGHTHVHVHAQAENRFPTVILISLCIHSFLEGMPINGTGSGYNRALVTGILLHNIPIAIALMSLFLTTKVRINQALLALFVFACMTPLGALVSSFLGQQQADSTVYSNRIMGLVVGVFLHISTTILFESSDHHRFNLIKFIAILMGAGAAFSIL
jgi:zinc and cadmium transporter